MQFVANQLNVKDLDELLDQLDQLAEDRTTSSKAFFLMVLDRLKHLLGAIGTALLIQVQEGSLCPIAAAGDCNWSKLVSELGQDVLEHSPSFSCGNLLLAFPFENCKRTNLLLVQLGVEPDVIGRQDILRLCAAFVDVICQRFRADDGDVQTQYLTHWNELIGNLSRSTSLLQAEMGLVNGLLPVLKADRVSICKTGLLAGVRLAAVSNHVGKIVRTETVRRLEAIGREVVKTRKAITHFPSEEIAKTGADSTKPNDDSSLTHPYYVVVPLLADPKSTNFPVVIVEWENPDWFLKGSLVLRQIGFVLATAWHEHQRWLSIPAIIRSAQLPLYTSFRIKRLALLAVLIFAAALGYRAAMSPIQLRMEMNGIIEPRVQRNVYAMLDGTIDRIEVKENQRVSKGQLLLTMVSPALEMQIKEVVGELSANKEKRDAIALSINQIRENQSNSNALMNNLTGEIKQLEIQRDTLTQKLKSYRVESKKLVVYSPIDGVIVAQDLDRLLDARPVRRGDPILKVVDPESAWHLLLQVADRDVGYVKRKIFGKEIRSGLVSTDSDAQVDFVFISNPEQRFKATLKWISESARNPNGDGVFVDAIATPEPESQLQGHLGATVKAYIECGDHPLWFVYSRSLVEAIQKKLWF